MISNKRFCFCSGVCENFVIVVIINTSSELTEERKSNRHGNASVHLQLALISIVECNRFYVDNQPPKTRHSIMK